MFSGDVLVVQEKSHGGHSNDSISNTRDDSSVSAMPRKRRRCEHQEKWRRKEGNQTLGRCDADGVEEKGKDHHGDAPIDAIGKHSTDNEEGVLKVG